MTAPMDTSNPFEGVTEAFGGGYDRAQRKGQLDRQMRAQALQQQMEQGRLTEETQHHRALEGHNQNMEAENSRFHLASLGQQQAEEARRARAAAVKPFEGQVDKLGGDLGRFAPEEGATLHDYARKMPDASPMPGLETMGAGFMMPSPKESMEQGFGKTYAEAGNKIREGRDREAALHRPDSGAADLRQSRNQAFSSYERSMGGYRGHGREPLQAAILNSLPEDQKKAFLADEAARHRAFAAEAHSAREAFLRMGGHAVPDVDAADIALPPEDFKQFAPPPAAQGPAAAPPVPTDIQMREPSPAEWQKNYPGEDIPAPNQPGLDQMERARKLAGPAPQPKLALSGMSRTPAPSFPKPDAGGWGKVAAGLAGARKVRSPDGRTGTLPPGQELPAGWQLVEQGLSGAR